MCCVDRGVLNYLRPVLSLVTSHLRHWGNPNQRVLHPSSFNLISWIPPSLGMLTVNFDGTVTSKGSAGGFAIRNHEGSMLSIGEKLLSSSTIPFAELIGAWSDIRYLITHFYTEFLWLQGDSMVAISWLRNLKHHQMSISPWMKDIYLWFSRFPSVHISHVSREANQAADWAAEHALSEDFHFNSTRLSEHPDLVCILKADAYSIGYPRHGL